MVAHINDLGRKFLHLYKQASQRTTQFMHDLYRESNPNQQRKQQPVILNAINFCFQSLSSAKFQINNAISNLLF
jgi:hypothetical protein